MNHQQSSQLLPCYIMVMDQHSPQMALGQGNPYPRHLASHTWPIYFLLVWSPTHGCWSILTHLQIWKSPHAEWSPHINPRSIAKPQFLALNSWQRRVVRQASRCLARRAAEAQSASDLAPWEVPACPWDQWESPWLCSHSNGYRNGGSHW